MVRWFAPDEHGRLRRLQRTFRKRDDAEDFQARKRIEFIDRPSTRTAPNKLTIAGFIDEFLRLRQGPKGELRPNSVAVNEHALRQLETFVGADKPLAAITPADARRFVADMTRTGFARARHGRTSYSTATINKTKGALRAMFNLAIEMGYLTESPFAKVKPIKVARDRVRYITSAEFKALAAADPSLWWRAFLTVCYTAGLRMNEAVHLTWADLDFETNTIHVTPKRDTTSTIAWQPKDAERRAVPVPPATMALLAAMQQTAPEGHADVFLTAERFAVVKAAMARGIWNGRQQVLNNFHRQFRALALAAASEVKTLAIWGEVEGERVPVTPAVSCHDLRRTAITNWSKVANMATVMAMAGHSDIKTTERFYATTTEDQLDRVRRASTDALTQKTDARPTSRVAVNSESDR